ncbi:MAG: D-amino acid aminotransferase [Isosphaeraceae bacterium]
MRLLACLNGDLIPAEEARVSIFDRGFLLGDAIYEVLRLYRGQPWLEDEHFARLKRSLGEVEIEGIDLARLASRMRETIRRSEIEEGTVYIQITRGVARRTHAFPDPAVLPTELIVVRPYDDSKIEDLRENGAGVISRPDLRWGRRDIKSTNLLANVLASEEAKRAGRVEAVLVDRDGFVTEATHSSLLWVRCGRIEGTPDGPDILPGTTRGLIRGLLAELQLEWHEVRVSLEGLKLVDELILVGTTYEILPVVILDDHPIADGRPGPIAGSLRAGYRRAIEAWLGKASTR